MSQAARKWFEHMQNISSESTDSSYIVATTTIPERNFNLIIKIHGVEHGVLFGADASAYRLNMEIWHLQHVYFFIYTE